MRNVEWVIIARPRKPPWPCVWPATTGRPGVPNAKLARDQHQMKRSAGPGICGGCIGSHKLRQVMKLAQMNDRVLDHRDAQILKIQ